MSGFRGYVTNQTGVQAFDSRLPTVDSIYRLAHILKLMLLQPEQARFIVSPVVYALLCRAVHVGSLDTLLDLPLDVSLDVLHIAVRKRVV